MLNRVLNVALKPKEEWPKIAEEQTSVAALMMGLVVPLAAIGPVCDFLNAMLFHSRWVVQPPMVWLLTGQIVGYVFALVGVLVAAFVVEKLAPNFQSSGDMTQALKLVAYAQAPFWVARVLGVVPVLGVLAFLVGLYGLYLTYVGLPFVMKTPQDKTLGYLIVVIIVLIVIWALIAAISGAIIGLGLVAAGMP